MAVAVCVLRGRAVTRCSLYRTQQGQRPMHMTGSEPAQLLCESTAAPLLLPAEGVIAFAVCGALHTSKDLRMKSILAQLLPEAPPKRPYRHPKTYAVENSVRYYSDGMDKMYQPNLFTTFLSQITLGLYIGVGHIMLATFIAAFWYPMAWWVLGGLLATLALPACPKRIRSVTHSYLFLCWRRYFHFSYSFDQSLDCDEDYVIAQFPHGAFPIGPLLCGTFMATEYPEYNVQALAAPSAFMVPVWRHVHAWLGTASCTASNFRRLLGIGRKGPIPGAAADVKAAAQHGSAQNTNGNVTEATKRPGKAQAESPASHPNHAPTTATNSSSSRKNKGFTPPSLFQRLLGLTPWQQLLDKDSKYRDSWNDGLTGPSRHRTGISIGVIVGGIAEMFLLRQDCEQIKLLGRKGFVRVAVETGTPILPVYIFGNSKVLSFGPPWLQRWSRKLRASLGIMYGVLGLPIPHRLPIYMAVGKPVPAPKVSPDDPAFAQAVDDVHATVVEAMQLVYYSHRDSYGHGYEKRPLKIV